LVYRTGIVSGRIQPTFNAINQINLINYVFIPLQYVANIDYMRPFIETGFVSTLVLYPLHFVGTGFVSVRFTDLQNQHFSGKTPSHSPLKSMENSGFVSAWFCVRMVL